MLIGGRRHASTRSHTTTKFTTLAPKKITGGHFVEGLGNNNFVIIIKRKILY
jgi:hypothetical protein